MFIYFLLLFLTLIASLSRIKIIDYLVIGLLFVVSAFRAESVGLDTTSYFNLDFVNASDGLRSVEFLYTWLQTIKPHGNNNFVIVVFSTITTINILIACIRFKVRPVLVFFFFILFIHFTLSLNIARQYVAASFLLLGYSYLYEENKQKYLFFVFALFAAGFHVSSWLFLPVFFIRHIDLTTVKKECMVAIIILLFILLKFVLKDYYLSWAEQIILLEDLESYSTYFEQASDAGLSIGGAIIVFSSLAVSVYIFIQLLSDKTSYGKLISTLFFLSLIIDIFFADLYGNLGRVKYNIDIINIIAYARYAIAIKDKNKILILAFVGLIYGYDFYRLMIGSYHAFGTVPYKFYF